MFFEILFTLIRHAYDSKCKITVRNRKIIQKHLIFRNLKGKNQNRSYNIVEKHKWQSIEKWQKLRT